MRKSDKPRRFSDEKPGFGTDRRFGGRDKFRDGPPKFDRNSPREGFKDFFDVVCDKCGRDCQVPFKPTGNKPVYCSDCFRKNESPRDSPRSSPRDGPREFSRPSNAPNVSPDILNEINRKLDKIIDALEID